MTNYYDPNKDNKKEEKSFYKKTGENHPQPTEKEQPERDYRLKSTEDPFMTEDESRARYESSPSTEDIQASASKEEGPSSSTQEPIGQEGQGSAGKKLLSSKFVVAGFWIRLVAYLIDAIVASAVSTLFSSPILALMGHPEGLASAGISGFFFLAYFVVSTKVTNGQTLGKMILGLRLVHPEEETLSWTTVIVREFFGRFIQNQLIILYLVAAFTPKKQHIVDMLVDTYVVKDALYQVEKDHPRFFLQYS